VLTSMGVATPSPLSSPPGTRRKQISSFPGPPRLPALLPCHHPRTQATVHRPGAVATPVQTWGTAPPGTGPGAGPGAWSRGRTAAVEPEHGEGHSLFWPPPAAALAPAPPPSLPGHVGNCCPSALDPTPAPRVHVPLFRPLEANPGMGLLPPPVLYACPGPYAIFSAYTVFVLPGRPRRRLARVIGTRSIISCEKILRDVMASIGRFLGFSGTPLINLPGPRLIVPY